MQGTSVKAESSVMDASSDGSDRRHPSWYPSRIGFVSRRPLPVQGAPSSSPPESLDARSVRVHATGPAGPRRPWDTDGYLSYNNSHFHRSANGGVILPSLSETRLLSRPAVESNPDANSLTDPLSMLSQHDLGRGSRLASQNAPVDLTAPSAPPSSSFQSTTSQTRVLSNNSLPWREAGFTDVYRFPERRWRRVYDRDFASFPNQDSAQVSQDFRPGPSDRRHVGSTHNPYARPIHYLSRDSREASQVYMSSPSPCSYTGSKADSEACANAIKLQDLVREIQKALHHPEYQLKDPVPTVDLDSLEEKSCNICYDEYCVANPEGIIEDPVKLEGCGHVFGSHCLGVWMRSRTNWKCPMCRVKIKPFIDTLYDNNLWVEYQQVRDSLSANDCLALLRRIVESKDRLRPPMKGLVVQQKHGKKGRPAPNAANESQQRRVRFRSNDTEEEVEGSGRTSDAPGMGASVQQQHHPLSHRQPTATDNQNVPPTIRPSELPWSTARTPVPPLECLEAPSSFARNIPDPLMTNSSDLPQLGPVSEELLENTLMAPGPPPYLDFGEAGIYEYNMPMFGSESSEDE